VLRIGIAGAGVLGRLLAWHLSRAGHTVTVFDPAPGPQAPAVGSLTAGAAHAAGFTAAGMLSPIAELDNAGPAIAHLGWRSLALWREVANALRTDGCEAPLFAQHGSLMVAHGSDLGAAHRVLARLNTAPGLHADLPPPRPLDRAALAELEPALTPGLHAWLLPGEAQVMPREMLAALAAHAPGVAWRWGERVERVAPGVLQVAASGDLQFDLAVDMRGVGSRESLTLGTTISVRAEPVEALRTQALRQAQGERRFLHTLSSVRAEPVEALAATQLHAFRQAQGERGSSHTTQSVDGVRGVRGEVVWLHAPGVTLNRPVRLLHPRHRVYIVPRPGNLFVVGASEIESEDRSPVSLRSAVELMAAAHSAMPELAEARIVHMEANLRPALPDNEPHTQSEPGLLRINGLFRHGWLLAPALVQDALDASFR
jgi:glycine oxidase